VAGVHVNDFSPVHVIDDVVIHFVGVMIAPVVGILSPENGGVALFVANFNALPVAITVRWPEIRLGAFAGEFAYQRLGIAQLFDELFPGQFPRVFVGPGVVAQFMPGLDDAFDCLGMIRRPRTLDEKGRVIMVLR